ncbi:phosphoribosylformylglycinamidine cyclo-ligase [Halolactibacillus alkaliphilus]|uniref:Phosphoribosylformylglycinamidine cyclo-ligase n=1 Tax=Halolactibacillus alkaliphilus TaxID=442899 RepID=A0A511X2K8_9BACI|nr:phosphoribosylformylglycinamidine cyclo-ligase [Halolactibacillus alkaliphilus]GEN57182.1 phosphoribosylformylglycinamidine cyclo-ligase [Halolactibacillus alkaliphilus]GGN72712.1 phosphoribosylformylglycinamidine cyclo-ligase [Halolactibacillus alkaliphilus]SFO90635.1 phosphoribosylformylglycinamidine cyclo-ligase [Halolactibacillus alkaliphilus]
MSDIYKSAGVDVHAGYQAVDLMKKHILRTNRKEVIGGVGAFAGLFDLSEMSYEQPVLVSGTDGVGTKLKLAFELNKHDTVGIDLVAMCVNDVISQGADPLFFLDYIACGKNEPEKIEQIVKGIADGCVMSGASLIGGETAEMPGMYQDGEYDLAGFTVGIGNKPDLITGESIESGDIVLGIKSSGVHSNGFSLVRKIIAEQKLSLTDYVNELGMTLGEALLEPTRIYVKLIQNLKTQVTIKGLSHVTGGGFYENLPRMLPKGLGVDVFKNSWDVLPIFDYLQTQADYSLEDMLGVFNMGIGMAVVVGEAEKALALDILNEQTTDAFHIGTVTVGEGVTLVEND